MEIVDPTLPRIAPPAAETRGVATPQTLERRDPPLSPPRHAELLDLDAVLGWWKLPRRRWIHVAPGPVVRAHRATRLDAPLDTPSRSSSSSPTAASRQSDRSCRRS